MGKVKISTLCFSYFFPFPAIAMFLNKAHFTMLWSVISFFRDCHIIAMMLDENTIAHHLFQEGWSQFNSRKKVPNIYWCVGSINLETFDYIFFFSKNKITLCFGFPFCYQPYYNISHYFSSSTDCQCYSSLF